MSKNPTLKPKPDSKFPERATHEDIVRIFGEINGATVLHIMNLQPTVEDLEQAALWLSGDRDVFGPQHALQHPASTIVSILTADEEDESRAH